MQPVEEGVCVVVFPWTEPSQSGERRLHPKPPSFQPLRVMWAPAAKTTAHGTPPQPGRAKDASFTPTPIDSAGDGLWPLEAALSTTAPGTNVQPRPWPQWRAGRPAPSSPPLGPQLQPRSPPMVPSQPLSNNPDRATSTVPVRLRKAAPLNRLLKEQSWQRKGTEAGLTNSWPTTGGRRRFGDTPSDVAAGGNTIWVGGCCWSNKSCAGLRPPWQLWRKPLFVLVAYLVCSLGLAGLRFLLPASIVEEAPAHDGGGLSRLLWVVWKGKKAQWNRSVGSLRKCQSVTVMGRGGARQHETEHSDSLMC